MIHRIPGPTPGPTPVPGARHAAPRPARPVASWCQRATIGFAAASVLVFAVAIVTAVWGPRPAATATAVAGVLLACGAAFCTLARDRHLRRRP